MKFNHRIVIAVIAAAVAVPFTFAAKGEKKKSSEPAFATVDKDSNGSVSRAEFVAAMKATLGDDAAGDKFGELDKNKDGKLSSEEFAAASGKKKGKKKK